MYTLAFYQVAVFAGSIFINTRVLIRQQMAQLGLPGAVDIVAIGVEKVVGRGIEEAEEEAGRVIYFLPGPPGHEKQGALDLGFTMLVHELGRIGQAQVYQGLN